MYYSSIRDARYRAFERVLHGDELPCESSSSHLNDKEDILEWAWEVGDENDFVAIMNNDRDVKFHKNHSSGTAIVRGSMPMSHDQHFWEIEMISPVYGTDMMIGVGTPEADMSQLHDLFISRLGKDSHTWGFSYSGAFYHNGIYRPISTSFDQGSIIGVHLDMWNGTLSFYKNKRHLGIASKGLKGKTLYAMASSTAACSGMRILRSCSFPSSLLFLCCAKLRDLVPDDKNVLNELNLPPGLKLYLKNNLNWLLNPRLVEEHPLKDKYLEKTENRFLSFKFPPEAELDFRMPRMNFVVMGQSHMLRDPDPVPNISQIIAPDILLPVTLREDSEELSTIRLDDSDEEPDNLTERDSKRRRYSYNYAVGLSDSDSDY